MHTKQLASVRSIATLFASTMILMLLTQSAEAQTLTVLHNFTGGGDGAHPVLISSTMVAPKRSKLHRLANTTT